MIKRFLYALSAFKIAWQTYGKQQTTLIAEPYELAISGDYAEKFH